MSDKADETSKDSDGLVTDLKRMLSLKETDLLTSRDLKAIRITAGVVLWMFYKHTETLLVGVLECLKLELYRQQVAAYEDKAIERNGDLE